MTEPPHPAQPPDSWSRPPLTAIIGFAAAGYLTYWTITFWVLWGRAWGFERGWNVQPDNYGTGSTDQLVVAIGLTVLVVAFGAAAIHSARHTSRYTWLRTVTLGGTCGVAAFLLAALL